ncbi:MAG: L-seryl-tRNA(Sec) selenium transferase [Acidimicrobiia bacterium]
MTQNLFRELPAVDQLVDRTETWLPRALTMDIARAVLEQARSDIAVGQSIDLPGEMTGLTRAVERASGTRVINASGVLLHTNLGRAVWSSSAVERATAVASGYTNLEMDLETGKRGRRGGYVTRLLRQATGAEDALVVNNNASALLLALAATSRGRAVPVSRGEMIEIGGAYRLPAVMEASGATLLEVGTTNRTRPGDYVTALQTHHCGAILKVHPSNYRVEGFTQEADIIELAGMKTMETPLIYDLGSGLLDREARWVPSWLGSEPAVRQALQDGADLVLFSGDKLLGGPQAGIMVGRADLIERLRADPMTRALRVDGVTYAALGATVEAYLDDDPEQIPFWRHALTPAHDLSQRSRAVAGEIGGRVEEGSSVVGAGSAPGASIPGPIVRIGDEDHLFESLLRFDRPVLARRDRGDLIIDLRAVELDDDGAVSAAIARCR